MNVFPVPSMRSPPNRSASANESCTTPGTGIFEGMIILKNGCPYLVDYSKVRSREIKVAMLIMAGHIALVLFSEAWSRTRASLLLSSFPSFRLFIGQLRCFLKLYPSVVSGRMFLAFQIIRGVLSGSCPVVIIVIMGKKDVFKLMFQTHLGQFVQGASKQENAYLRSSGFDPV